MYINGLNDYSYTLNNPLKYNDALGLDINWSDYNINYNKMHYDSNSSYVKELQKKAGEYIASIFDLNLRQKQQDTNLKKNKENSLMDELEQMERKYKQNQMPNKKFNIPKNKKSLAIAAIMLFLPNMANAADLSALDVLDYTDPLSAILKQLEGLPAGDPNHGDELYWFDDNGNCIENIPGACDGKSICEP